MKELSGGARIDEVRWNYCKTLTQTFKAVNKFMPEISANQFQEFVAFAEEETKEEIPYSLIDFLKHHLKTGLFCEAVGGEMKYDSRT